jgi:glycosyltransferase involved in cell wall biosynthesis
MRARTVVYVQYTDPAVYPPVQHSASILAENGWQVIVLGIAVPDVARLEFPEHPRIQVHLAKPSPTNGWRQKIHYLRFNAWAFGQVLRRRAGWVYASDVLTAPLGWAASCVPGVRVVYHEHDSPGRGPHSSFMRRLLGFRRALLKRAAVVVAPNDERGRAIAESAGQAIPLVCVWNCPRRHEAASAIQRAPTRETWVVYQGSIVPARVPRTVIEALALAGGCVKLRVIGYETAGHIGYIQELRDLAASLGVQSAIEFIPTVPRNELLQWTDRSQIGLSLMPLQTDQINERWMRGASNKSFEYLARGVPVLVSALPEWKATFVDTGFGLACRPDDPQSIAEALRWFHDHSDEARQMGDRGRERILNDWNYEQQFAAVLERMTVSV